MRICSREAGFVADAHACLQILYGDKILQPFATAKKGVRMIPTRSHFFAAKKVASQTNFKMADMQQSEQSQYCDVSGLLRAEIVPENAGNSALSPVSVHFDKELFLEEVRKYRCLWDVNSEGYKLRPMKQNAWIQISAVLKRDGKFNILANINNQVKIIVATLLEV